MAKGIKTGGRQKGTPNRSTKEIRSLLSGILCNEIERIPEYLEEIQPEKRLQVLVKLLPFIIPVYSEQQEEGIEESPMDFVQRLNKQIIESNTPKA